MYDEDDYIIVDTSVKQNRVIEEKNPELEIMEAFNINVDEEE